MATAPKSRIYVEYSQSASQAHASQKGLTLPEPVFPQYPEKLANPGLERVSYCEWFGSGPGLNHGATRREDQPAWGLTCAAHRHHFTEQWLDSLRCGRWWYVAVLFASRSWAAERGTKYLLRPALFRDQGRFSCAEDRGCSPKFHVARALCSACS